VVYLKLKNVGQTLTLNHLHTKKLNATIALVLRITKAI